jgi:hypothetical protein
MSTELCPNPSRRSVIKRQQNLCANIVLLQSPNFIFENLSVWRLGQMSNSWQRCQRVWVHRHVSFSRSQYLHTKFQLTSFHETPQIRPLEIPSPTGSPLLQSTSCMSVTLLFQILHRKASLSTIIYPHTKKLRKRQEANLTFGLRCWSNSD